MIKIPGTKSGIPAVQQVISEGINVNTLPPNTIEACADHCEIVGNQIETGVEEAYRLLESLKQPDIDINLDEVMDEVLEDGIKKFVQPFQSLMESMEEKVKQLAPA